MKGFIYVLSNPSLSSVKIGKTKADPTQRTKELTQSTSIPTAFKLEYSAYVEDFDAKELEVHLALETHRVNKKREFFDVTVAKAISTIEEICTIRYCENQATETAVSRAGAESINILDEGGAFEAETVPHSPTYLQKIIHEGNGLTRGSFNYPLVPVYERAIRSWLFILLASPAVLVLIATILFFVAWFLMVWLGDVDYSFEAFDLVMIFFIVVCELAFVYGWLRFLGWLLKVDFSNLRRPNPLDDQQGT